MTTSDKLTRLQAELQYPLELAKLILERETLKKECTDQSQDIWEKRLAFVDLKRKLSMLSDKGDEDLLIDKERPVKKNVEATWVSFIPFWFTFYSIFLDAYLDWRSKQTIRNVLCCDPRSVLHRSGSKLNRPWQDKRISIITGKTKSTLVYFFLSIFPKPYQFLELEPLSNPSCSTRVQALQVYPSIGCTFFSLVKFSQRQIYSNSQPSSGAGRPFALWSRWENLLGPTRCCFPTVSQPTALKSLWHWWTNGCEHWKSGARWKQKPFDRAMEVWYGRQSCYWAWRIGGAG